MNRSITIPATAGLTFIQRLYLSKRKESGPELIILSVLIILFCLGISLNVESIAIWIVDTFIGGAA